MMIKNGQKIIAFEPQELINLGEILLTAFSDREFIHKVYKEWGISEAQYRDILIKVQDAVNRLPNASKW